MRILKNKNSSAQGTIEYLVILAVVLVVSLVVVGLFVGMVNPNQTISASSDIKGKIGVGGISIVESVVGADENGLLVLKNMGSDNLILNKIVVDDVDHEYNESIVSGEQKSFKLSDVVSCDGKTKSYSVEIEYTSGSGLNKIANFETIEIDCSPFVNSVNGVSEVLSCSGNISENAILCPNDNVGLTQDTQKSLVYNCSSQSKCEYICNENTYLKDNLCNLPDSSNILVNSWEDLNNVRNDVTKNYYLKNNLDAFSEGYVGIGDDWQPIGGYICMDEVCYDRMQVYFDGIFDGQAHTISNLVIDNPRDPEQSGWYVGLFGLTGSSSKIINTGLVDVNVVSAVSGGGVGSLVGVCGGLVKDCFAIGSVNAQANYPASVGGLVGHIEGLGYIRNSYADVNVIGAVGTGGLLGVTYESNRVINSYAVGAVLGNTTQYSCPGCVGRLVGTGSNVNSGYSLESLVQNIGYGGTNSLGTSTEHNSDFYLRSHAVYRENESDEWDSMIWNWNVNKLPSFFE